MASAPAAAAKESSGTECSVPVPSQKPPHSSVFGRFRKFLKRSRKLFKRSCNKDCPTPIALSVQGSPKDLPKEDRRRHVELITTNERTTGENGVNVTDRHLTFAIAHFDFAFDEGPGMDPYILVNNSLCGGRPVGFKAYPDPKNAPIDIRNSDGTKMELLGEFPGKWSPRGLIKNYAGQQIFLNPNRFISCRCVAVPEESPFDILIGLRTIEKYRLDKPLRFVATTKGQGGKHDAKPRVDRAAVDRKRPTLDSDREAQLHLQNKIERERDKEKRAKKQ